jgi:hypothetical protein
MMTLNLQLPKPVAAEFFAVADQLNARFGGANSDRFRFCLMESLRIS